jgi:hypothetical protein
MALECSDKDSVFYRRKIEMTDKYEALKAAALAAKDCANEHGQGSTKAWMRYAANSTPSTILELIAERDALAAKLAKVGQPLELSGAEMLAAIRPIYKNDWIAEQALEVTRDDFTAILAAANKKAGSR